MAESLDDGWEDKEAGLLVVVLLNEESMNQSESMIRIRRVEKSRTHNARSAPVWYLGINTFTA